MRNVYLDARMHMPSSQFARSAVVHPHIDTPGIHPSCSRCGKNPPRSRYDGSCPPLHPAIQMHEVSEHQLKGEKKKKRRRMRSSREQVKRSIYHNLQMPIPKQSDPPSHHPKTPQTHHSTLSPHYRATAASKSASSPCASLISPFLLARASSSPSVSTPSSCMTTFVRIVSANLL